MSSSHSSEWHQIIKFKHHSFFEKEGSRPTYFCPCDLWVTSKEWINVSHSETSPLLYLRGFSFCFLRILCGLLPPLRIILIKLAGWWLFGHKRAHAVGWEKTSFNSSSLSLCFPHHCAEISWLHLKWLKTERWQEMCLDVLKKALNWLWWPCSGYMCYNERSNSRYFRYTTLYLLILLPLPLVV